MADGRLAYDPDRLPWLADERRPRRARDANPLLFWAFLAAVLVAATAYWLGMRSVTQPDTFSDLIGTSPPAATVQLPEAAPEPVPERPRAAPVPPGLPDAPAVAGQAPVEIPGVERALPPKPEASAQAPAKPKARMVSPKARARSASEKAAPSKLQAVVKRQAAAKRPAPLQAWPAAVSENAYGRVARIGTFSSRRQAKKGWWAIVRHYPGMRRLKAVVAPVPSLRNGRTYYRLQFGTTSQAHSEILCQRMRIIGQSCSVVGVAPPREGARR